MIFTDDDLKRLKEFIGKGNLYQFLDDDHNSDDEIDENEDNYVSINALLSRLEAAENWISVLEDHHSIAPDEKRFQETWRKAAGK